MLTCVLDLTKARAEFNSAIPSKNLHILQERRVTGPPDINEVESSVIQFCLVLVFVIRAILVNSSTYGTLPHDFKLLSYVLYPLVLIV